MSYEEDKARGLLRVVVQSSFAYVLGLFFRCTRSLLRRFVESCGPGLDHNSQKSYAKET
jgi:hypothetical protein